MFGEREIESEREREERERERAMKQNVTRGLVSLILFYSILLQSREDQSRPNICREKVDSGRKWTVVRQVENISLGNVWSRKYSRVYFVFVWKTKRRRRRRQLTSSDLLSLARTPLFPAMITFCPTLVKNQAFPTHPRHLMHDNT